MTATTRPTRADQRGRFGSRALLAAVIAGLVLAVLVAVAATSGEEAVFGTSLPNPMGGQARTAPGTVYADGELTQAGQQFIVPPKGAVLLQLPLQMHPGMDGAHHLVIPLEADSEQAAVQVTGNFTDTAYAG